MKQLKISDRVTTRDPSVDAYLRSISRLQMVTPAEEVELAETIRKGGKAGQRAKTKLVNANLRFVVSVAKQYQHQGLELSDLIAMGNLGLIKAADKFDETRGFRFISYAVWWIRQSILQALAEQARVVRLPLNQVGALNRLNRAIAEFEQTHQRRPSIPELSEIVDLSVEKITDVMSASGRAVSVDAPVGDDGNSMLDTMSGNAPATDGVLNDESLSKDINSALSHLGPRDAEIVRMFYGIGCQEMTLEEIGQTFNLSRERVRQIKERALRQLRRAGDNGQLQSHLG